MLARRPTASAGQVATALALALLAAADWTPEGMLAVLQSVFGRRHRFLPVLVREVRAVYRTAPQDAPRELAAVIRQSAALTDALDRARAAGRPLAIVHHPVSPGSEDHRESALPHAPAALSAPAPSTAAPPPRTLTELAALLDVTPGELDWLADTGGWNRRAPAGPLHHYRYEWRSRPGRVPRLLEVPTERMRAAQRILLHEVFALLPLHGAAHGFVPGRSALTAARLHTGRDVVIALDLVTFFTRVTAGRVYGALRQEGTPERIALALTGLATNRVPARVIGAMPPGGDPDERFALRQALAAAHLPQGAPTSPALANLAIRRVDSRLAGYAEAADAVYTRYADDLTFSGPVALGRRADAFIRGVTRIVEDEGHLVNRQKTRVRPAATSQRVTGIVVNEHTALPRVEFDRLKAILHNCAERGPESQNHDGHSDFRAHLLGRLSWARDLNPSKTERLEREFARIRW
ncbi:reverse transcriptase family protein [Subtercola boreus]|uniref:reverse transcriptase family protein n=1 Tax=Subtercola boreus TaxID=120213 RepID=UPI00155845CE|nr:reverse transcriptase family protein [Subtercola boreus]